jgi:molybdate transport system substrate-binding protein
MKRTVLADTAATLLLVGALLACFGCSASFDSSRTAPPSADDTVTVFAAASLTNAMDELKADFAERTGAVIRTNYAGSSTLAQQIVNGAPADIFFSANVSWAEHVAEQATVLRRRDLLGNRLVVVVPVDSQLALQRPQDLLAPDLLHLSLADPDAVPAGKYARQALTELGLWEDLRERVVPGKDVRHALTYVETGAAEAGIVYATDAAASSRVRVAWEIPVELTAPIIYPALLLKQPVENRSAAAFFDFLASKDAASIFEKHGFVALTKPAAASPETKPTDPASREP